MVGADLEFSKRFPVPTTETPRGVLHIIKPNPNPYRAGSDIILSHGTVSATTVCWMGHQASPVQLGSIV